MNLEIVPMLPSITGLGGYPDNHRMNDDQRVSEDRNQLLDFLREVRTHIARHSPDFSHQFGTSINNSNQIFKISTGASESECRLEEGGVLL
jgi:hypothetical protein